LLIKGVMPVFGQGVILRGKEEAKKVKEKETGRGT